MKIDNYTCKPVSVHLVLPKIKISVLSDGPGIVAVGAGNNHDNYNYVPLYFVKVMRCTDFTKTKNVRYTP